ncbi:hypothetical protein V2I01_19320 [Micromonospora sp. BRA006-A]|nr:hypothetical protein [Micromonospora sp. BRA006-A]
MVLLYRSEAIRAHLVRHRKGLVVEGGTIAWREVAPKRPQANGWLLTARVAAFTYSPLMLVPALVATGAVLDGRLAAVPALIFWFGAGIAVSYAVLFCTAFLLRDRPWARKALVVVTLGVLVIDLPLCWWLLGTDGLIRDGAPWSRPPPSPSTPPPRHPHPHHTPLTMKVAAISISVDAVNLMIVARGGCGGRG